MIQILIAATSLDQLFLHGNRNREVVRYRSPPEIMSVNMKMKMK